MQSSVDASVAERVIQSFGERCNAAVSEEEWDHPFANQALNALAPNIESGQSYYSFNSY
jgi:hypothetical protein